MTVQMEHTATPKAPATEPDDASFELDMDIVEGGVAADQIIRLTGDNCGSTCQSACVSCP
ncbi:FxLD family lantipeptide [Streptomyces sp. WAC05292]|uniref:FxLD family lanthipeptide n=1 Tax=Streptomyces sp. WAC05292 TaxID=2487418 RepID=UPI000F73CF0E|nr:FxLD family lanthipeptide [Streptomyces sp. WAC05292]RSS94239.1 FxLD family lantipeptide [Streptomyces sp. WAC05292]